MAANKVISFGPVPLSNVATNIINPPSLVGGTGLAGINNSTYVIIRQITIVNKSSSSVTFSLFKGASGASAAGTEVVGSGLQIPANSSHIYYCGLRFDTADFLTGFASALTSLTFQATGEIGVA